MKYKMTDRDYDELYLYLSPREIKEEYGAMSKSARWIQSYYKERGRKTWKEANKELKDFSYDVADIEVTEEQWLGFFCELWTKQCIENKESIWKRARLFEELFQCLRL